MADSHPAMDAINAYNAWVDAGNGTQEDIARLATYRKAMLELRVAVDECKLRWRDGDS